MHAGSASREIGSAICLVGTLNPSCVIGAAKNNCNANHLCRIQRWRRVLLSDFAGVDLLLL